MAGSVAMLLIAMACEEKNDVQSPQPVDDSPRFYEVASS